MNVVNRGCQHAPRMIMEETMAKQDPAERVETINLEIQIQNMALTHQALSMKLCRKTA